MTELLTREQPAPVVAVDTEARRVTVRLCRWGQVREVADAHLGGQRYREAWPAGSLTLAPDVHVIDHHHGDLIGRADPATYSTDGEGPTVELTLARTAAASDTLALIEAGVIRSVSMEVQPTSQREADGVLYRTGVVHGIAFAFRPAHDAPILALREQPPQPHTHRETAAMSDTTTTDTATAEPPAAAPSLPPDLLRRGDLEGALDELRREVIAVAAPGGDPDPLLRYRSLGEYADAVWAASPDERALLHRALADQVTTTNPGVVPEGWVREVKGIIDQARNAITSFGAGPLPAEGMQVDFPYFDGDLTALVAAQATEKTGITSVKVDIKRGSEGIGTYAGGSDISYQLIRRSSPSYRDAYLRIMAAAYSLRTELAAGAAISAAATASALATFDPATGDAEALLGALFAASLEVEAATGAPATFALADTATFLALGSLTGVLPPAYGVQNVAGTAQASTLRINVSGLEVLHSKGTSGLIVSNQAAGAWLEDGPMTVTAEDVEKLGQNVAVWGMGAFMPYLPAGIVSIPTA